MPETEKVTAGKVELLEDCLLALKEGSRDPYPAAACVVAFEGESPDEALAYARVMVPAHNACFEVADNDPERAPLVAAEIVEAFEIVRLTEKAELARANCSECNGEDVPELCGECFPMFDDIRCRRRALLQRIQSQSNGGGDG